MKQSNASICSHPGKMLSGPQSTLPQLSEIKTSNSKEEFTLVGTLEANPSEGKISVESPIGKAIINHKVGEEISIESPVKITYRILKIKFQKL